MTPRDRDDREVREGDVFHVIGRVERAGDEHSVLVRIDDHLSVWVSPKAGRVIDDQPHG